jgi:23S rRNA (guanosine2251-2'-O)-methyltransferase
LPKECLVYGVHAVNAVLQKSPRRVKKLYVLSQKYDSLLNQLSVCSLAHVEVIKSNADKLIDLLGEEVVHQGVVATCHLPDVLSDKEMFLLIERTQDPIVLILDQVQDPHNLGACLRTANAMGACCVIIPKNRAVGLTPVVEKVACGATVVTPLVSVTNLSRCLKRLQELGLWLVGLTMDAPQLLDQVDLRGPVGLLMGGEGRGLRELTIKSCDYLAKIQMHGTVNSMNVSVATGMALYEAVRQRRMNAS